MTTGVEAGARFPCFGSTCSLLVSGDGPSASAEEAVAESERQLLEWHEQFTRFDSGSGLSRLNADPRPEVPVSPLMARFVAVALSAAQRSAGLVDATLLSPLEQAGYERNIDGELSLADALELAPPRRAAAARLPAPWGSVAADVERAMVRRPPGLRLDSGGLAKGLFADVLGERLGEHESFAIDCAGDLRLGGAAGLARPVRVVSPFDGELVHEFELAGGGVATSGIGRRSWVGPDGKPAHHLLDPSSGRPAYTGVVQVTALAPTAVEAEIRAKAAVLGGPRAAPAWIPDGGVVVHDDGSARVIEPR